MENHFDNNDLSSKVADGNDEKLPSYDSD